MSNGERDKTKSHDWSVSDIQTVRILPEVITGLEFDAQGDLIIVTDARTVGVMHEELEQIVEKAEQARSLPPSADP